MNPGLKIVKCLTAAPGPGLLMLCLALLASGCASGPSSSASNGMTSNELYNEYDQNNDNQISQAEWDQAYRNMDTNGDGVVTQDEFNAAARGGGGRR